MKNFHETLLVKDIEATYYCPPCSEWHTEKGVAIERCGDGCRHCLGETSFNAICPETGDTVRVII